MKIISGIPPTMGAPSNICLNRQSITQAATKFCPLECQNVSQSHSSASPPPCSGHIFHPGYGGGFLTLPALNCSVPIHSPNSKQKTLWKRESDHVTSLFKTSQMFPIDLLVNPLTWFYKTVVIYILLQLYVSSSSASATAYQSLPFFPSPILLIYFPFLANTNQSTNLSPSLPVPVPLPFTSQPFPFLFPSLK